MKRLALILALAATPALADDIVKGSIVKVEHEEIYVNIGAKQGVGDGAALRIKRPINLRHPISRAAIVDWVPVGSATITQSGSGLSRAVIGQLIEARAAQSGGNVVAVEDVPRADTNRYGIVSSDPINGRTSRMSHIVEKPAPDEAPSTLAVVGRYVLEPEIFEHLRSIPRGAGGEVQLTDAIACMLSPDTTFAYRYQGRRFDCGSKEGFVAATVHFARKAGYSI
jgi:UTP--glucose-1-phosphate uridylyltransferase